MYIKGEDRKRGILFIDDNFASLERINPLPNQVTGIDRDLHFKFYFKVSQSSAINEGTFSVTVTVRTMNKQIPVIVPNNAQNIDAENLVNNILTNSLKIRKQNSTEESSVLVEKTADITSKIDNSYLTALKLNVVEESQFKKTKILLKKKQDVGDINFLDDPKKSSNFNGRVSTNSSAANLDVALGLQNLSARNLVERKNRFKLLNSSIHPSSITSTVGKTFTPYQSLTGCSYFLSKNILRNNLLDSLSNFHHFEGLQNATTQKNNNEYEVVVDQTVEDLINVNLDVVLKQSHMFRPQLIVEFSLVKNLINVDGKTQKIIVETVEKYLDIEKYYNKFLFSNLKPLSAGVSKADNNVTLQIKNHNESACNAEIFVKELKDFNKTSYQKLSSVTFDSKNQISVLKLVDRDQDAVYRIIASDITTKSLSNDFTDVVIRNPRKNYYNDVITIPHLAPNSINIFVLNNSYNFGIVACKVLYRNLTKKERDYTIIRILNVNESTKENTCEVKNLIPYNVYEVTSKLIYENGVEVLSKNSNTIQYIPYSGRLYSASVQNLLSVEDITFDLTANLQDDQIGQIRNLLTQVSGRYDTTYYSSRETEYDKFVAFQIFRYSLLDGSCEDMGIINNNASFSDSAQSSIKNIPKLVYGANVRYVIYPLVRDPSTITETAKELIDPETRKKYVSNFRKNRHPSSLVRGNILSKSKVEKDTTPDMLYGMLGDSLYVDVRFGPNNAASIKNFIANRTDLKTVVLSWNIEGKTNNFDHILVFKEENGVRTLIGKTHSLIEKFDFSYNLTLNDVGNIRFILVPIHQDFSSGNSIMSNYILVNNAEVE